MGKKIPVQYVQHMEIYNTKHMWIWYVIVFLEETDISIQTIIAVNKHYPQKSLWPTRMRKKYEDDVCALFIIITTVAFFAERNNGIDVNTCMNKNTGVSYILFIRITEA